MTLVEDRAFAEFDLSRYNLSCALDPQLISSVQRPRTVAALSVQASCTRT
jgi:hypothetical protein